MSLTAPMSLSVAVLAAIDPDAYTAATYTTGWISTADFQSFMAVIMAGTLGASATIDAKIEQATDASGTGAKDLANSEITQLTQAGTDDSDKQAVISFQSDHLDLANGFDHVRLSVTVGTATSDMGAVLTGSACRYGSASDNDGASVAEIVTL